MRIYSILRPRRIPRVLACRLLRKLVREHPEGGHLVRPELHGPPLRHGPRKCGQRLRGERRLREGRALELADMATWRKVWCGRRAVQVDGADGRLQVYSGDLRCWSAWRVESGLGIGEADLLSKGGDCPARKRACCTCGRVYESPGHHCGLHCPVRRFDDRCFRLDNSMDFQFHRL